MSEYSDNFYSWMNRRETWGKIAEDEMTNGYKHPDGSPCRASKKENCPFYKKEKKDITEIDDISTPSEVSKVEKSATPAEMDGIKWGANPNDKKFEKVEPSDLATMDMGSTKSKYREMRNALVEYVEKNKLGDGTFPLVDVNDKEALTEFKSENYDKGYMVSFQTTNGEGYNKQRQDLTMSDEDYDTLVDDLTAEGYKPHVGVYGGIPEISFLVDSKDVAEMLMEKYNQVSMWDNAAGSKAKAAVGNPNMAEQKVNQLWKRANIPNLKYNWKENQVVKSK